MHTTTFNPNFYGVLLCGIFRNLKKDIERIIVEYESRYNSENTH